MQSGGGGGAERARSRRRRAPRPPKHDLSGRRVGRLRVVEPAYTTRRGWYWRCVCRCKTVTFVIADQLRRRGTRSCGCLRRDSVAAASARRAKHGLAGTRLYYAWHNMHQRCVNPRSAGFRNYGERGIKVCRRWRSLLAFVEDMGEPPSTAHTLERKRNGGNYTPSNCRWATKTEQNANRRNSLVVRIGRRRKTLAEWCREYGAPHRPVAARLKRGWEPRRALTTPVKRYRKRVAGGGE